MPGLTGHLPSFPARPKPLLFPASPVPPSFPTCSVPPSFPTRPVPPSFPTCPKPPSFPTCSGIPSRQWLQHRALAASQPCTGKCALTLQPTAVYCPSFLTRPFGHIPGPERDSWSSPCGCGDALPASRCREEDRTVCLGRCRDRLSAGVSTVFCPRAGAGPRG